MDEEDEDDDDAIVAYMLPRLNFRRQQLNDELSVRIQRRTHQSRNRVAWNELLI